VNKIQQFFFNLARGPQDKDILISELRRQIEALKKREMELRSGNWVMWYFDLKKELDDLRDMAEDLYQTGDHQASCPPDEECTCGFTNAAYNYSKYAMELYKTEQVIQDNHA
jgi:hypothetical protein